MKKKLTLVVSLLLVMALSIGGTVAYLTYTTDEIVNTFTIGNVKIALTETTGEEYQMIPGSGLDKNPTITVDEDSENCWVFVKVEGNDSYADYLTHEMAEGWTAVSGVENVFVYAEDGSNEIAANTEIPVLKNNQVTVLGTVTQEMMDDITSEDVKAPTLTITAYAVQYANVADVTAAWAAVNS